MEQRIAVVIPVFNRAKAVVDALESVAAQTRPADRIVVVDDGSVDETAAAVERWIARQPAVPAILVRQSNQHVSAARNNGVAAAGDVDLVAFLDSDDLWPPDHLARTARVFADRPDIVAACTDLETVFPATGLRRLRSHAHIDGHCTEALLMIRGPMTSCVTARSNHFRAIGGFDPRDRIFEDLRLALRMSMRGPWAHVRGAPVIARRRLFELGSPGQHLTGTFASPAYWRSDLRIVRRFMHLDHGALAVPPRLLHRRLARGYYRLGKALSAEGDHHQAITAFRRALLHDPCHHRARLRMWLRR